jgi:hypothetical protein
MFGLMNTVARRTAIVGPSCMGKSSAAREFAVLACRSQCRVVFLHDKEGMVSASTSFFHLEVSGSAKTSHIVYDLKSGGSINIGLLSDYDVGSCSVVPDVVIVDVDFVSFLDAMRISDIMFNNKLVVVTRATEEYLALFVDKYHYIMAGDEILK